MKRAEVLEWERLQEEYREKFNPGWREQLRRHMEDGERLPGESPMQCLARLRGARRKRKPSFPGGK